MEREIQFYSEGIKIFGTLSEPDESSSEKLPAVVLGHGYGAFRDELKGFFELAAELREAQFVSLRIDFRGCGKSGVRGRFHPQSEWVEDLRAAISYLQSLPDVDPKRIGIVGMSVGGGTVCYTAAIDKRVKCVVALAPVADGEWWLRHLWETREGKEGWEKFKERLQNDRIKRATEGESEKVKMEEILALGEEDLKGFKEMVEKYPPFAKEAYLSSPDSLICFKPINYVHLIAPRPILFIHSMDDTSVPIKHSFELYGRAEEVKDLNIIHGSPHCFWISDKSKHVQRLTVNWLKKFL